jgi:hypothetical protein
LALARIAHTRVGRLLKIGEVESEEKGWCMGKSKLVVLRGNFPVSGGSRAIFDTTQARDCIVRLGFDHWECVLL